MSSATFDFTRYLTSVLSIRAENLDVQLLPGGFTNLTARTTFKQAIKLPSSFNYSEPVTRLILKMGTPFMHMVPSCPVPISRQAVEARALRILQGEDLALPGVGRALAQSSPLKAPKLIFHDAERQVLWMTDLGESNLLSDHILYDSPPQVDVEKLGTMLGRFFGNLFVATQNPTVETVRSLSDSRHLLGFLTAEAQRVLSQLPPGEYPGTNSLIERMQSALDQRGNLEPCLGMIDFWPGSALIGKSGECSLVDWEYFGLTNPGTELGMFVGHFHFLVLNDEASTQTTVITKAFISSFASAYFKVSPGTSNHFKRKFLIAYGRSLIGGTNLFARAYQPATKSKAIDAGITCLRAVGDETSFIDWDVLDGLPLDLLSGVKLFLETGK
ncbi:hypothetical protein FRC04_002698 [Tulasnella sp. 424]|nr:hypothetical protein FRC04_002698 [Tulasnella sp. 424]KAG8974204.1 hypothetical protein FRC05_007780 [Tulasnella sp. 425]